jgi:ubiquinone/menaquinone biosynthesis C-methylase UbiE
MNPDSQASGGAAAAGQPASPAALKKSVQSFWNAHPCGSKFAGEEPGTLAFFRAVEEHRYAAEPHIREMASFAEAAGKRVLEIGCGLGTDGAQFAQAGAEYVGMDLSAASVTLASANLRLRNLPAGWLVSDAESLPFADNTFDLVYSNGVLHHTPDLPAAVAEVRRILRPNGRAIVMMYHKTSLNYYVGIQFLRRLGALLLATNSGVRLAHLLSGDSMEHLREHSQRLRQQPWGYLRGAQWLNNNTDGVGNPLSRVLTRSEITRLFAGFSRVRTEVRFLHAEWIPLARKLLTRRMEQALGRRIGWHLYVVAEK